MLLFYVNNTTLLIASQQSALILFGGMQRLSVIENFQEIKHTPLNETILPIQQRQYCSGGYHHSKSSPG